MHTHSLCTWTIVLCVHTIIIIIILICVYKIQGCVHNMPFLLLWTNSYLILSHDTVYCLTSNHDTILHTPQVQIA